jgi:hypothetical protein
MAQCADQSGGTKAAIRAFLAQSTLKPHRVYYQGDPTVTGSARKSTQSYFLLAVSNRSGSDFPAQVRDAEKFVTRHIRAAGATEVAAQLQLS